jgi:hypothetical protein
VFLGKELGPERMFEAYASFAFLEKCEREETAIRRQPR